MTRTQVLPYSLQRATMLESSSAEAMSSRLEELPDRFERLEGKFDRLEQKLDALASSVALASEVDAAFAEQREYTEFAFGTLRDEMRSGFARIERKLDRFIDVHLTALERRSDQ